MQDPRTRRVVDYAPEMVLAQVRFVVQEAGRQRVLRERRKTVHAFAEGAPLAVRARHRALRAWGERLRYDPYRGPTFVDEAGEAVLEAPLVYLDPAGRAWTRRPLIAIGTPPTAIDDPGPHVRLVTAPICDAEIVNKSPPPDIHPSERRNAIRGRTTWLKSARTKSSLR